MILHSIPKKPLVYLPLPSCQDSSMFHLLKYSFFPIPWKERYTWKRELLLGRSLLPSHLPAESCAPTVATSTLWMCQVVGHLLFAVCRNNLVISLFLLEPFSNHPLADRTGTVMVPNRRWYLAAMSAARATFAPYPITVLLLYTIFCILTVCCFG